MGNDCGYFEHVEIARSLANSFAQEPSLLGYFTFAANDATRLEYCQIVAAHLRIGEGPGHVGRERVLDYVKELADETPYDVSLALAPDVIWSEAHSNLKLGHSFFLRPASRVALADMLQSISAVPTLLSNAQVLPHSDIEWSTLAPDAAASMSRDSINRLILSHRALLFLRRAAAVAFASAVYRHDHQGAWPATLDDLVPTYLPSRPIDPCSPVQSPLIYRSANSGTRHVVLGLGSGFNATTRPDSELPPPPSYGLNYYRPYDGAHVIDLDTYCRPKNSAPTE